MRVAILMATYNGGHWLCQQMNSLLAQKDVSLQLIVGDDLSDDNTMDIIKSYSKLLPLIILPSTQRSGSAAANFFRILSFVEFEKFDYVFFCDQDDYWFPDKVISGIDSMIISGADCYASNLTCLYENGKKKLLRKNFPITENDFLFQGASAGCTYGLSVAAAQVVRDCLSQNSLTDFKDVSHDWIIYAITRSRGFKWFIDNRSYIHYRQHSSNAWGALGYKSYMKRWKLLRNGWYRRQILFVASLCSLNERQANIVAKVKNMRFRDKFYLLYKSHTFRRSRAEKALIFMLIFFGLF